MKGEKKKIRKCCGVKIPQHALPCLHDRMGVPRELCTCTHACKASWAYTQGAWSIYLGVVPCADAHVRRAAPCACILHVDPMHSVVESNTQLNTCLCDAIGTGHLRVWGPSPKRESACRPFMQPIGPHAATLPMPYASLPSLLLQPRAVTIATSFC